MRTVTTTELRAEKGTTAHAFAYEIARVRDSTEPIQITRQTGAPEEREPARLISHDHAWTALAAEHTPKTVQEWGARYARRYLRKLLDAALRGAHTVITVDGVPTAVFVPTAWHRRATEEDSAAGSP